MIFRISMRRRGIKNAHVLRCVVYSADAVAWTGVLLLSGAVTICAIYTLPQARFLVEYTVGFGGYIFSGLVALLWAGFCYRLYIAYKKYLGFDLPFATILATQVVLVLTLFTTMVLVDSTDVFEIYWHFLR